MTSEDIRQRKTHLGNLKKGIIQTAKELFHSVSNNYDQEKYNNYMRSIDSIVKIDKELEILDIISNEDKKEHLFNKTGIKTLKEQEAALKLQFIENLKDVDRVLVRRFLDKLLNVRTGIIQSYLKNKYKINVDLKDLLIDLKTGMYEA